jgi:hypothetical protein
MYSVTRRSLHPGRRGRPHSFAVSSSPFDQHRSIGKWVWFMTRLLCPLTARLAITLSVLQKVETGMDRGRGRRESWSYRNTRALANTGDVDMPAQLDRDQELLEALPQRGPTAAWRLVVTYRDRAYRLAERITRDEQDAEEVIQDAFWAVVRKIDSFRGSPWVPLPAGQAVQGEVPLRQLDGLNKTRVHRARLFLRGRLAGYMGASLEAARS